jgi:signal transduction histidine kinase
VGLGAGFLLRNFWGVEVALIKLTLVSKNPDTCSLIQDIARSHPSLLLSVTDSAANIDKSSDVYIWDFEPGLEIPASLDGSEARRHLFLVRRKDLSAFRLGVGQRPGVGILLKPVAWPVLEAYLENAAKPDEPAGSLNAGRDEILQSLIQANLKLQEYDQDRTNFLARAVHDFRAPLTALSGYCGLLLGEQLGPLEPEQKEVLTRMDHSAKRLSRMASAMFQLSVGRVLEIKLHLQAGDLQECVEQAVREVLPLTSQKGIEVLFDWVAPPAPLHFESSQMEQVLINLLENACKFTPKCGVIEISGHPWYWDPSSDGNSPVSGGMSNGSVSVNTFRVDVRDSGPSVPAPYLEKIFEEYTTYSGGCDRAGGGLGLAICKSIIGRHQGRIWAENSAEGIVFSLLLPMDSDGQHSRTNGDHCHKAAVLMEAGV